MKPIRIRVGDIVLDAELNDSKTARLVWEVLPFEANGRTWGDEIYFKIPVDAGLEAPQATVNLGDIGYGKTPASGEDDIVPASPVDVIGRVTSDVSPLKAVTDPGRVTVDKGM